VETQHHQSQVALKVVFPSLAIAYLNFCSTRSTMSSKY